MQFWTGVYILENTLPPSSGGRISANVIWGGKYEKGKKIGENAQQKLRKGKEDRKKRKKKAKKEKEKA